MPVMIVTSPVSLQSTRDAIGRAAFNLRKYAMSQTDRDQAAYLEALVFEQPVVPSEPMMKPHSGE